MKTKRVYELVYGDVFIHSSTEYIVYKIEDGRIHYKPHLFMSGRLSKYSFGAKNQMKVQMVDYFNRPQKLVNRRSIENLV